ncbi:YafY family protein [Actinopolymorpha sp. B17G11]|uniref:helix-turn-helix transcriptional regulator n=1 Tax=Actinopolymorpha sp. B17G11 TaxID=3160861 RepID=UPI0032E47F67
MSTIESQHPTTRILALLELLQAHHRLTGVDLAERLGVDPRTVRRYATRLADLGIPVEADRGRYGGYRLRPGYKLPPLMFTDDEATGVVLGLLAARAAGVATTTSAVATESALAKITRVLPDALRDQITAVPDTLGFGLTPRPGHAPPTAVVLRLATAAHQRHRVRMSYASRAGERSVRDLDPYGLVVQGGRWYVTGHDHRRGEIRTFRVDRIADVEVRAEGFTPPADFDAVDHVHRSLARVPWTHEVEVVVRAPLAEVRRRLPPSMATLTELAGGPDVARPGVGGDAPVDDSGAAGGVVVTLRAERLDGVAQMLAGLGWPFVIRRPAELRDAVRALAGSLHTYAGATPHEPE